ncbi:MAG: D-alanine--D-alanine ligase family protein [Traorella sp.]
MKKIRLGVVFGGKSSEYSVSLHSVSSMLRNCDPEKYEIHCIGITQQGNWYYLTNPDFDKIEHDTWLDDTCVEMCLSLGKEKGIILFDKNHTHLDIDVIFPVLHGKNGEDGTVQGYFELAQIPYVGCRVLSSSCVMDKEFTHILCESADIPCSPYICIYKRDYTDTRKLYEQSVEKLGQVLFIKPCNAGSSYGISKVRNYEEFKKGMEEAFKHDTKVLIEKNINGFEIGCAVLGNDELVVGECDEIETHKDFFDFDAKYELEATTIHCPARISEKQAQIAKEMAKKAYRVMNCQGFCRVDMFVCENGEIILNELNTIPGLTATSRYPSMISFAGYKFNELIDCLIQLALDK